MTNLIRMENLNFVYTIKVFDGGLIYINRTSNHPATWIQERQRLSASDPKNMSYFQLTYSDNMLEPSVLRGGLTNVLKEIQSLSDTPWLQLQIYYCSWSTRLTWYFIHCQKPTSMPKFRICCCYLIIWVLLKLWTPNMTFSKHISRKQSKSSAEHLRQLNELYKYLSLCELWMELESWHCLNSTHFCSRSICSDGWVTQITNVTDLIVQRIDFKQNGLNV